MVWTGRIAGGLGALIAVILVSYQNCADFSDSKFPTKEDNSSMGQPTPTPSPTATPSPTPTPIPLPTQWTTSPATTMTARYGHSIVWTGTKAIVFAGQLDATPAYGNALQSFDPVAGTWAASVATVLPSQRAQHSAVYDGAKMIVFGGIGAAGILGDLWCYTASSDSWAQTTHVGTPPTARRLHRAVWTGSKMIVWGGINGSGTVLGDGAIWDMVTGWTAMNAANAPTARFGHSMVWTGSKMIVWGGYNNTTTLSDGSIFDPVANTWTPISAANPPTPRMGAVSAWQGSYMIIWGGGGGVNGATALSDGAAYNLSSNTWTSINIIGAPSARRFSAGAWMGSKFFVWGGYSAAGAFLADGGLFY